MSKKIGGVIALAGMCALSLFLLNCGSSSSRPSGVLYVLTQGSNGVGNNVSSFAIDLNSGSLSLVNSNASTCPAAASNTNPEPCGAPLDILLDPTGATALVLNQGIPSASVAPTIYSYGVNSDGSLGAATLAATLTDGDLPVAMVRDTTGQFLFVIDQGSFPPPGYPTPSPTNPSCPHVPTSATDVCPSISVFAMKSSSLTLAGGEVVNGQPAPLYLSKIPSALSVITFTPPGSTTAQAQELLFVTNNEDICSANCLPPSPHNDNTVSVYTVSSSGVLSEQPNSPYAIAASSPNAVLAVNTNPAGETTGGLFVYVGQGAGVGALYPFQVCTVINAVCNQGDVNIALMTPLGETCPQPPCNNVPPTSVGSDPVAMLVDPTNNFLYLLSEGSSQVYGFQINTSAGTLANPTNLPTGSQPGSMAMHPSVDNTGQFLFVSSGASDNVTGFALSTTSGSMSGLSPVITPSTPSGLAVH
jgi:hypothetical protein